MLHESISPLQTSAAPVDTEYFEASPVWIGVALAFVFIAASFIASGSANADPLHAAVRRAGAQLTQSSQPVPQTNEPAARWVVQHPVIVGALIGTAAGAALSRTEAIGGKNHDPRVALMGTGVGAWGGLIASAVHKARSKEKVGVGTKIGIAAGAVGLIVLPVLACYGAGGCGGSS